MGGKVYIYILFINFSSKYTKRIDWNNESINYEMKCINVLVWVLFLFVSLFCIKKAALALLEMQLQDISLLECQSTVFVLLHKML